MLEKINSPEDVKKLNYQEKKELAEEIRKYILEIVSENGGHLASNLGIVELTIALHSIFNVPNCMGCRASNLCTQNFNRKKRKVKNIKKTKWNSRISKNKRIRNRLF